MNEYGWLEFLQALSDNEGLGPVDAASVDQPRDNFYAKSVVVPDFSVVTQDSANSFFQYVFDRSKTPSNISYWFIEADLYGGRGSAVAQVPSNATAYGNRPGLFTFQLYGSKGNLTREPWNETEFGFLDGMADALTNGRDISETWHFPCYPDARLKPSEWHKYYSSNYPRLVELKEELDKTRVFGYPQAIGPLLNKVSQPSNPNQKVFSGF
jgi:hypothetical protein